MARFCIASLSWSFTQGGDFIRYEDIKESEKIACEISAKAIDYREIYVGQSGSSGTTVRVCQGVEIVSFTPAGVKESVNRKYFLNDTNIKSDRQLYLGKVCLSETINPTLSFMSQDELPLKISGLSYGEYHTVIYDAVTKFLKQRGLSDEQIHSVQIIPIR